MDRTIIGIMENEKNVEDAVNELKDSGYNPKEISIVMKDKEKGQEIEENTGGEVVGGAVSGATTGAIIGGIAGLVASFIIPGLGAFFIGGPIAAALGLTGAAASTVSGAATGLAAGGLIGGLAGLGLSKEQAEEFQEHIKRGGILIAVPTSRTHGEIEVREILDRHDASKITSVAQSTRRDEREEREFSEERGRARGGPYAYAGVKGGKSASGRSNSQSKSTKGKKGGKSSPRKKMKEVTHTHRIPVEE